MRIVFICGVLASVTIWSCSSADFGSLAGKPSDKTEEDKGGDIGTDGQAANDGADIDSEAGNDQGATEGIGDDDGEVIELPLDLDGTADSAKYDEICSRSNLETFQTTLNFAANSGQECEWGKDGNYKSTASKISARRIFAQSVALPAKKSKVVICDFDLTMNETFTRFDDDIILMLDGGMFASDYLGEAFLKARGFPAVGKAMGYDFDKVKGATWPSETAWKEAGVEGDIKIKHDANSVREGSISIKLTKEFLKLLPADKLQSVTHELSFVTHGNLHATDCQHDGLEFALTVKYAE